MPRRKPKVACKELAGQPATGNRRVCQTNSSSRERAPTAYRLRYTVTQGCRKSAPQCRIEALVSARSR